MTRKMNCFSSFNYYVFLIQYYIPIPPKFFSSFFLASLKTGMVFMTVIRVVLQMLVQREAAITMGCVFYIIVLLLVLHDNLIPPWTIWIHLFGNIITWMQNSVFIIYLMFGFYHFFIRDNIVDEEKSQEKIHPDLYFAYVFFTLAGFWHIAYGCVYWSYYQEAREKQRVECDCDTP